MKFLLCALFFLPLIGHTMETEQHYGFWPSPITAELVAKGAKRYGMVYADAHAIYWEESRPMDGGRSVVMRWDGRLQEMTPPGYSTRTRVYEYGGASFTVHEERIYFINDQDQRVYMQERERVRPLTAPGCGFANLVWTPQGLLAIGESKKNGQTDNFLAIIDETSGEYRILASGADFYASPAISPDGKKVAWLSWNHPNMPWDGTELWCADFMKGTLGDPKKIAGGDRESIFQPSWDAHGRLHWVSDQSGWWNLYREGNALFPMDAEFGMAQWVFGMSTYAFWKDQIVCTYCEKGVWHLALLDPKEKTLEEIPLPGTVYGQIRASQDALACCMGSPTEGRRIIQLDLNTLEWTPISEKEELGIDPCYFSKGESISFPSKGGRTAHAFYYPPCNPRCRAHKKELPPLIVRSHGGPTAAFYNALDLTVQYWTSRGFAVLDVNYGGSTGYGRKYRELLNGQWGIVDKEDCEEGALALVKNGQADPERLLIAGGSAGGYTTLCALAFGKTFAAGASYYGVSDLLGLTGDTHKFESRYLDHLVGSLPGSRHLYKARSPLRFADQLYCPVIFFQGAEDKIVVPAQSEMMYEALKKKGIKTELIMYPGEQHGFRKAEHIRDALERELAFYLEIFSQKNSTE